MACDMAISGYNTFTTNCLRRWKCVDDPQITKVTLINQERLESEEERVLFLKQRYFYISASIKDVVRRYKKRVGAKSASGYDFSQFPEKVSF